MATSKRDHPSRVPGGLLEPNRGAGSRRKVPSPAIRGKLVEASDYQIGKYLTEL